MKIPAQLRRPVAKIAAMDWDEIRSRGAQALAQRMDMVRVRLGVPPEPRVRAAADHAPHRFFFDPAEIPFLVELLRDRLPAECEEINRRAERICEGRFDLLGYENLGFGGDIDWHLDPVSGRRSPMRPWYQIPFLDFDAVGDAKVTWEINRHQHWVILARAYLLTKERCYVDEIAAQWKHWWTSNPYAMGINWASALEVAFRSLSWLWVRHLLSSSPAFPRELADDFSRGLVLNGRHLATYLSTYFSPNTHLLGEAVALFFIGTLVPEASASRRWQRQGWQVVIEQAGRQVLPDGLHFERSAYYHVYSLDFFLHARVLAGRNGIPVPAGLDRALVKQLDVLNGLSLSDTVFQFGDDDGGRVFDGARNRSPHLLDPLATGAALFASPELKAAAGGLREETIWLLGQDGVRCFDEMPQMPGRAASRAFQHSKMYLMVAAEPVPRRVLVVPGAATELGGGHAHADLLSIQLALDGKILLEDSGTFEYVGVGAWRDRFRGTNAHNTLEVGGCSQGLPSGPFSWRALPEPTTTLWLSDEAFDYFVAHHDGYARPGAPLRCRRCIFSLTNGVVLVRDTVDGDGSHRLNLHWHLAAGVELLQRDACTHLAQIEGQAALALITCADHGWKSVVERGWASPAYGRKEPRPVVRFSQDAIIPTDFVTLLCPIVAKGDRPGSLRRLQEPTLGNPGNRAVVTGYLYEVGGQRHLFFFAPGGIDWQLLDWKSDASFLYCRVSASLRRISEAVVIGGSYVHWGRDRRSAPDDPSGHWGWQD